MPLSVRTVLATSRHSLLNCRPPLSTLLNHRNKQEYFGVEGWVPEPKVGVFLLPLSFQKKILCGRQEEATSPPPLPLRAHVCETKVLLSPLPQPLILSSSLPLLLVCRGRLSRSQELLSDTPPLPLAAVKKKKSWSVPSPFLLQLYI